MCCQTSLKMLIICCHVHHRFVLRQNTAKLYAFVYITFLNIGQCRIFGLIKQELLTHSSGSNQKLTVPKISRSWLTSYIIRRGMDFQVFDLGMWWKGTHARDSGMNGRLAVLSTGESCCNTGIFTEPSYMRESVFSEVYFWFFRYDCSSRNSLWTLISTNSCSIFWLSEMS